MISKVQKWGNSLAFRIPKVFADEMKLDEGSSIQLMLQEGALIISPIRDQTWELEALVSLVTEDNLHDEWEAAPPAGKEAW